jgi:hypothetical protein
LSEAEKHKVMNVKLDLTTRKQLELCCAKMCPLRRMLSPKFMQIVRISFQSFMLE